MITIGWFHFLSALVALGAGAFVLLRPKGSATHRRTGWVYAVSMLLLNVTALTLYNLTGRFGFFHVAALLSLATVSAGVVVAVRRRPQQRWVEVHYYWMTYSYVGLLAAAASEAATRIPDTAFWWTVLAASLAVLAVGAIIITRKAGVTLAPFLRQ